MSTIDIGQNLRGLVRVVQALLGSRDEAGGAYASAAIDRLGFGSVKAVFAQGTASGSPTGQSCACKLQESDTTTAGDFTDVSGATFTTLTANDTNSIKTFDLRPLKRYIRFVATPDFTGGTSPATQISVVAVLGAADTLPAQGADT
jgi:hypothetical protein